MKLAESNPDQCANEACNSQHPKTRISIATATTFAERNEIVVACTATCHDAVLDVSASGHLQREADIRAL